jgi:tetratricopeptide (TPR) repeat protein
MSDAPGFDALAARARAALDVGRLEEAERAARSALAADPGAEDGHALLARTLVARGDADAAVRAAEAGLGAVPDSEWLHRLRALALYSAGRCGEALPAADEAVRLAPDQAPPHFMRSLILEKLKRIGEARGAAERALELDPDDEGNHAQLGDLWLEKDPVRAERHYRDSLAIDAAQPMTLNNLGVALNRQERTREAALAFRSAVILDPTLKEAKKNAHASIRNLVRGGPVIIAALLVARAARIFGVSSSWRDGVRTAAIAVGAAGVLVGWGVWLWRRTVGIRRLAETEPQLHAIYTRLEADRKAGGLKG